MRDNLKTYNSLLEQVRKWLPEERITRLRNLALLMTGLYLARSPHLSVIANHLPLEGKLPSLTNRLRRFLDNSGVEVRRWYEPILKKTLSRYKHKRLHLVVDCTKLGFNYRLMTIAASYRKRTLPLAWSIHQGSRGSVSVVEQIALFHYLQPFIPKSSQVVVLGDSEFQHVPLLKWFRKQGWSFVIRQGCHICVKQTGDTWRKLGDYEIVEGQTRYLEACRLTKTHDYGGVNLIIHWAEGENEPWFLVSNLKQVRTIIRLYNIRMWIEQMYGDLKGHGFDLETTGLRCMERLSRLVLAASLLFMWLISVGSWLVKRGLRHLIDRKDRRDKSYFRLGLDWLRRSLRLGLPLTLRFCPYI